MTSEYEAPFRTKEEPAPASRPALPGAGNQEPAGRSSGSGKADKQESRSWN
ncbi:TPA: hypothetical protein ACH3X2_003319 [Trebouxia sp. C0005]